MKKFTLVLVTMLCFVSAVRAQTYVTSLASWTSGATTSEDLTGIPSYFTNNGHTHFVKVTVDNGSSISNCSFYDNDFTTNFLEYECSIDINDVLIRYWDISNLYSNFSGDSGIFPLIFTQNLFNFDDHYEYIEVGETEWRIKSTSGSTVQTINAEEGYLTQNDGGIMKIDDNYYLILVEKSFSQDIHKILFYRIDHIQGLTKVNVELPISVFPTMTTREHQITVELGEGNNAKEVTVVNSLGQVVKRVPIEEGQREITIPTSNFSRGLNVVNTRTEQGQGSCKIIVQ